MHGASFFCAPDRAHLRFQSKKWQKCLLFATRIKFPNSMVFIKNILQKVKRVWSNLPPHH